MKINFNAYWLTTVPLVILIFLGFKSLDNDIKEIKERIINLENTALLKGTIPKEFTINNIGNINGYTICNNLCNIGNYL